MKRKVFLCFAGLLFFVHLVTAQDFITKWKFDDATSQIQFYVETAGPVNYSWSHSGGSGSGSFNSASLGIITIAGLDLPANTELTLSIEPTNFRRFIIRNATASRSGLIDIAQWGAVPWSTMQAAFANTPNLNISAPDMPDLSNVTNMNEMFSDCPSLTGPANIGSWNTSNVTNMQSMFRGATSFNQPLDTWNTSNVTNMSYMFYFATSFNQPLNSWNTSNVTDMSDMFYNATSFNQPLSNWNTGNVTNMSYMFHYATSFNQPIGMWDVQNVKSFSNMFYEATSFNQNLGGWHLNSNTSNLDLSRTAVDCENYSRSLKGWAENNPSVTGQNIRGRVYGPAAAPYREQLISQGWNFSDTYDADCSVVLPVVFGDITAFVQNNHLQVDWTTLSENSNDHFVIEVSTDGVNFTAIGQQKTQAKDGNSTQALQYKFSKNIPKGANLLGLAVAAFCGLCLTMGIGKKQVVKKSLIAGMLLLTFIACKKADTPPIEVTKDIYIRIKQVDKDAQFKYSKIVKAIIKD